MFRTTAILLAFGLLAANAHATGVQNAAPAGTYKTDPSHSSLTWSFSHFGLSSYTARFTKVDARLSWDPANPQGSALSVEIDPLSVRTDFPWPEQVDFDAKIASDADFLAARPIRFVSKTIRVTGDRTGTVDGLLTFRDETRPATLAVTFNGSMADHPMMGVPKLGFSATGTIRRSEWGLGFAIPELGDEVHLVIETQMVPENHVFQ